MTREGGSRRGESGRSDRPGGVQRREVAVGKRTLTGSLSSPNPNRSEPLLSDDELVVQRKTREASAAGVSDQWRLLHEQWDAQVQQRGEGADTVAPARVHEAASAGLATPAQELPHRERLEESLGHDLSGVRAHVGGDAEASAGAMGAEAYASGNDVVLPSNPSLHLVAHEVTHVLQQQQGVQLKGGVGEAGDAYEREADAVADRVVAGQSAAPLLASYAPRAVASHSAAIQKQGKKGIDRARYDAIEGRLKTLLAQKKAAVEGNGNMGAADAEIDALVAALHTDFGVRLDKGKILEAAAAGRDMLVVNGRVQVSPSGGEHYMGERLRFAAEIDHVPPGEGLQIGWRWRTDRWGGPEFRFVVNGPAFNEKTTALDMELDTQFWGLLPPAIEQSKGMQVAAQLYIGSGDRPTTTLYSPYISLPERPVGNIKIVGAPEKAIVGQYVELGIGPWTPDVGGHAIDWFVDERKVAGDQVGLRHQLGKLGAHKVRTDVHTVRRSFGVHDKAPLTSAETTIEVVTPDQFGTSFLDEAEGSPTRPKPVALGKMVASGEDAVDEMEDRVDQGGSQQPYWEDRLKGQKERLGKVKELAPDYATAKPLPEDPTKLEAGSYNGPISAALVMAQHGGAQPLILHLTIRGQKGAWTTRLIDSSSRKVVKADGAGATPLEAYESAFETWRENNEYPTGGRIVHRFAPAGWSKGHGFDTYTPWKRAKEWVDGLLVAGAFVSGAILLGNPDPTISKLVGGILMAAVLARSSVAIYERIRDGGDVLSSENILDGIAIVTSFIGVGGTVLRSVGLTARNPMVYRAGNWMVMGALAGDAGTFVYVSAEALAQMHAIQGDPTLDDGQKASETLRIMASLFATGAMLIASNKELLRNGLKPTDFVQGKLERSAKPDLDVGSRLDAEYELKQAGKWSKETSKLSDEAVLDRVFDHRSRQELETSLAAQIGAKPAGDLATALGDKAFVALHSACGEQKVASMAKEIGVAHLQTLPFDRPTTLKDIGTLDVAELETLLRKMALPSRDARNALWSLDVPSLKRITTFLTRHELEVLAHAGPDGLRKLEKLHSFHLRNLATLTPSELAAVSRLDANRIEKLSTLEHTDLRAAAPFDVTAVDAKLRSLNASESEVAGALADPDVSHHLRETNFLERGEKQNAGGKGIKVKVPGKGGQLPIESASYVRLEAIPPSASGGSTPTQIARVEVEGHRVDVTGKPVVKGELTKGSTDWEVPVPGSPYPKVTVEVTPGGTVPYVDVETPPPGTRIQIGAKAISSRGFAGGHTREAWNTTEKTYGDLVKKTRETNIRFTVPGSTVNIEAASIEMSVTSKGVSKPLPDPKTIFETTKQLDAFETHARPYIAAKAESLRKVPLDDGQIVSVDVPVATANGEDAIIRVEFPLYKDASGQLEKMTTWWLAKSNFAKGSPFNP